MTNGAANPVFQNRYGSDTSVPLREGDFFSKFIVINKKGEGTFSEVLECRSKNTTETQSVAIKRLKTRYPHIHAANKNREIQAMRRLAGHPNVLKMRETLFEAKTGTLFLILDLMDMNLFEYLKTRTQWLSDNRVRFFLLQLIDALRYVHKCGIFHRDVKPENILVRGDTLRLADFGSCRSREARQPFTEYISTRWYRAPECLLTDGFYDFKMDVWSTGCVFFELLKLAPLFPGNNEIDQIDKIHRILGTPPSEVLSKFKRSRTMSFNFPQRTRDKDLLGRMLDQVSRDGADLLFKFLEYDPDARITMEDALHHPYITKLIDKLKKRKEDKAQSGEVAGDTGGRVSASRFRATERVPPARQVTNSTERQKHQHQTQHVVQVQHKGGPKTQRSPVAGSHVLPKNNTPVFEKQILKTNAELRNTKQIVQNIRNKAADNNPAGFNAPPLRKNVSKSLNNLTTIQHMTKAPQFQNDSPSARYGLPLALNVGSPLVGRQHNHMSMFKTGDVFPETDRVVRKTDLKLPYLSQSLGNLHNLQMGAERKFGPI